MQNTRSGLVFLFLTLLFCTSFAPASAPEDVTRVLLIGDSTTLGALPRAVNPNGPQLEGMIEQFAAIEGLPKLEVINTGKGGETAHRLLASGWYDKKIAVEQDIDYIFIRMGINDWFRLKDFEVEFPANMKILIDRLRQDHPKAKIILSTICRFMPEDECEQVNDQIKAIAKAEKLSLFDLYTPYNNYLSEHGQHALNVRQPYLDQLPEQYHDFLKPYLHYRKAYGKKREGYVVRVDGTELDPLFGHVKSWYYDHHPNTTGYRLIALETVRFLETILP